MSRLEGIITSVGAGKLSIRPFDGLTREYTVSAAAQVRGEAKPPVRSMWAAVRSSH